jgi:hypothetical protein
MERWIVEVSYYDQEHIRWFGPFATEAEAVALLRRLEAEGSTHLLKGSGMAITGTWIVETWPTIGRRERDDEDYFGPFATKAEAMALLKQLNPEGATHLLEDPSTA